MTRVTNSQLNSLILNDINSTRDQLQTVQEQLSSGTVISKPSDDPFGTSQVLAIDDAQKQTSQYQRTVSDAQGWLQQADTAIGQMSDLTMRARELAIQSASAMDPQDRSDMANEINQIIDSIKEAANTKWNDNYVFGGTANTPPYVTTDDLYHGDAGVVNREVSQGVTLPISQTGQSLIGDGTTGLIKTLRDLSNDLTTNNVSNITSVDMPGLTTALDTITSAQAKVGAITNRIQIASSRLDTLSQSLSEHRSNIADADYGKLAVQFNAKSASLQAALQAAAKIDQQTLMDFLQ